MILDTKIRSVCVFVDTPITTSKYISGLVVERLWGEVAGWTYHVREGIRLTVFVDILTNTSKCIYYRTGCEQTCWRRSQQGGL